MAQTYRTRDGDTADLIAWKHYGRQDGQVVEMLIDANPGLADRGPILPEGIKVTLPDFAEPEQVKGVRLWD
jgi:phage tail protein X